MFPDVSVHLSWKSNFGGSGVFNAQGRPWTEYVRQEALKAFRTPQNCVPCNMVHILVMGVHDAGWRLCFSLNEFP